MVGTVTGQSNIPRKLEQIYPTDMKIKVWGYFVLEGIGQVTRDIIYPLTDQDFTNIPGVAMDTSKYL